MPSDPNTMLYLPVYIGIFWVAFRVICFLRVLNVSKFFNGRISRGIIRKSRRTDMSRDTDLSSIHIRYQETLFLPVGGTWVSCGRGFNVNMVRMHFHLSSLSAHDLPPLISAFQPYPRFDNVGSNNHGQWRLFCCVSGSGKTSLGK